MQSENRELQKSQEQLTPTVNSKRKIFLSKYADIDNFCVAYAPSKIIFLTNDAERCFMGDSPTLVDIKIMYGTGADAKWLSLVLAYINEMPSGNRRMDSFQISAAAATISSSFFFLKASEILLFFRNLMGGKYGKVIYGGLDGHSIGAAIRDYFLPERAVYLDRIEQEERERKWQEHLQHAVHDTDRVNSIVEKVRKTLSTQ